MDGEWLKAKELTKSDGKAFDENFFVFAGYCIYFR
jgi:hypothetical protein